MNWFRIAWKLICFHVRITEFLLASLVFWVLIGAVFSVVVFKYEFHDALLYGVFWPLANTQWVAGFSEDKLDSVKQGMSEEAVTNLLGPPLKKLIDQSSGDYYWIYSWRQSDYCCDGYDGNFHRREVRFASSGVVKSIHREFDAD